MIYKVIPGPKTVQGSVVDASKAFEGIINAEANGGWKYHSMESITSVEKPGCFLKGVPQPVVSYMLIFYKED